MVNYRYYAVIGITRITGMYMKDALSYLNDDNP